MKKLLALLPSCFLSSIVIAEDTFDSTTGNLYMPVVSVEELTYEVDMV